MTTNTTTDMTTSEHFPSRARSAPRYPHPGGSTSASTHPLMNTYNRRHQRGEGAARCAKQIASRADQRSADRAGPQKGILDNCGRCWPLLLATLAPLLLLVQQSSLEAQAKNAWRQSVHLLQGEFEDEAQLSL